MSYLGKHNFQATCPVGTAQNLNVTPWGITAFKLVDEKHTSHIAGSIKHAEWENGM